MSTTDLAIDKDSASNVCVTYIKYKIKVRIGKNLLWLAL